MCLVTSVAKAFELVTGKNLLNVFAMQLDHEATLKVFETFFTNCYFET